MVGRTAVWSFCVRRRTPHKKNDVRQKEEEKEKETAQLEVEEKEKNDL